MLPPDVSDDPVERFEAVVEFVTGRVIETEAQQRTMLRLSLEADAEERAKLVLRQGRVIGWLEEALRPLRARVPDDAATAGDRDPRATIGIESYVWLTDVAGLSPDDAVATMRWSANVLLRQTLRVRRRSTVAGEVVVDDVDAHRTLADRGRDAFDRSAPHVTDHEHAGHP